MILRQDDTIVFEGDSLTSRRRKSGLDDWAFLRMQGWDRCYPHLVEEWLFANLPAWNVTVRVAAAGGSTVDDLLDRHDPVVKPMTPTLLIFTIGNNDAFRMDQAAFGDKLSRYLDTLAQDSSPRLLYVGNFPPAPEASPAVVDKCDHVRPYNRLAAELVQQRGGSFLDMSERFARQARALRDRSPAHTVYAEGRHFNTLGATVVAGQVLKAIGAIDAFAAEG